MSVADKKIIMSANNVTIAENEQKVYDKGYDYGYEEGWDAGMLEGLATTKGHKTQYIQEYFTGSKQYLTYSIDFEPKLIFFESNDSNNTVLENKPDIDVATLNIPKIIIDCADDFTEAQEYALGGATVWRYKKAEDTLSYASSTAAYINYTFNQTTGKWDVTLGRADSSTTATRFVSSGSAPIQVLFIGEAETLVKKGDTTLFTDFSRTLTISGFPSLPKTFTMIGLRSAIPTDDNQYFIAGLDFFREGFNYTGGTDNNLAAAVWLRVTTNVSSVGAGNGTISMAKADKVFIFENGNFTIDLSAYSTKYGFGANYTYKWIATF